LLGSGFGAPDQRNYFIERIDGMLFDWLAE
jgi:hypothetical protein